MYVAIEGVIGVGKTTLARLIQTSFEAEVLLEVFEENPFLSDFYSDRQRFAFQTQIFFLLSRYRQQNSTVPSLLASGHSLISDYTFSKDALFARINLAGDELDMYHRVHAALAEKIPTPDLVVYLRASPEDLFGRVRHDRNRPLLAGGDALARLRELHAQRDALYRATADIVVDTGKQTVLALTRELIDKLGERWKASA